MKHLTLLCSLAEKLFAKQSKEIPFLSHSFCKTSKESHQVLSALNKMQIVKHVCLLQCFFVDCIMRNWQNGSWIIVFIPFPPIFTSFYLCKVLFYRSRSKCSVMSMSSSSYYNFHMNLMCSTAAAIHDDNNICLSFDEGNTKHEVNSI